jgi:hypothetical protein
VVLTTRFFGVAIAIIIAALIENTFHCTEKPD